MERYRLSQTGPQRDSVVAFNAAERNGRGFFCQRGRPGVAGNPASSNQPSPGHPFPKWLLLCSSRRFRRSPSKPALIHRVQAPANVLHGFIFRVKSSGKKRRLAFPKFLFN